MKHYRGRLSTVATVYTNTQHVATPRSQICAGASRDPASGKPGHRINTPRVAQQQQGTQAGVQETQIGDRSSPNLQVDQSVLTQSCMDDPAARDPNSWKLDNELSDPAVSRRAALGLGLPTLALATSTGSRADDVGTATTSQSAGSQGASAVKSTVAKSIAQEASNGSVRVPPAFLDPFTNMQGVERSYGVKANNGPVMPVEQRKQLGLTALQPSGVQQLAAAADNATAYVRGLPTPMDKYQALIALQQSNANLFHYLIQNNVEELLPLVYTPTVADAALQWGSLLNRPLGLYVTLNDKGKVADLLAQWPYQQVRLAVITDGGRILGLGDVGVNGQAIPCGKSMVYTACAGIDPRNVLPITVDVGCSTRSVRDSGSYLGLQRDRIDPTSADYTILMNELVDSIRARFGPDTLIHWEDLTARAAYDQLASSQERGVVTLNDDIQGTAAVTMAALLGAQRHSGCPKLQNIDIVMLGAGQANIGAARLLVKYLASQGVDPDTARARLWLLDSKGLVTASRTDLSPEKREFAIPSEQLARVGLGSADGEGEAAPKVDLASVVQAVRPAALVGAAATPGTFDEGVLKALTEGVKARHGNNARPVVLALSNPASKAECSYEEAFSYTRGAALYASGTQFPPLTPGDGSLPSSSAGKTAQLKPSQANNCFVFPGVGMGIITAGVKNVSDDIFLSAAQVLAGMLKDDEISRDQILPSVSRLREAANLIASSILQRCLQGKLGDPNDLPDATYECLVQQSASEGALLPQGGGSTGKAAQAKYCVSAAKWRPAFK